MKFTKQIITGFLVAATALPALSQTNNFNVLDRVSASSINGNTTTIAPPTAANGSSLQVTSANGSNSVVLLDSFAASDILMGRRANNTAQSPQALADGNTILAVQALGYGATAYSTTARGAIAFQAVNAWTDSAQATQILFLTTPVGSTTTANAMVIASDQSTRLFGRLVFTTATPTVSSCGTGGTLVGSDNAMQVTVGSGGVATSCAVTFSGTGWSTNPPICTAQNNTDIVAYRMVTTTTTLTITASAAFTAGSIFHVQCFGRI